MMLAQLTPATPEQLGNAWIIIAAIAVTITSILGGAYTAKKLFGWGEKGYADVSRADLDQHKKDMDEKLALYARSQRVEELGLELKDLRAYTHSEIHEVRNIVQEIRWQLRTLIILLRQKLPLPELDLPPGMGSKFDEKIV